MLQASKVERPQASICSNGDEAVRRTWYPSHIIYFSIVGDQLCDGTVGEDVPDRACGVDGGCDH